MPEVTKSQVVAALRVTAALAETIRELGSVPAGHLYANVMEFMTYQSFTAAIATLVRAGLVTEKNNVITWAGPTTTPVGDRS